MAGGVLLLLGTSAVEGVLAGAIFSIALAAVALLTLALGAGPGLVLAAIVGFGGWFFILEPPGFALPPLHHAARLIAFFVSALTVVLSIALLERTRRKLAAAKGEADRLLEEQRESSERLRALSEAMPQFVFVLRPDGSTEWVNERFTAFTGLDMDQVNQGGWGAFFHPDDLPLAQARWVEAKRTGRPQSVEIRYRARDGSYRWHLITITPLKDLGGRSGRWMGTVTDIHDRKLAEEALRASERALREADRRKDDFLGVLSHELRNPLAPIRNCVHILEHSPPGGEQSRHAQAVISRQVQHLSRLIDDLLDVTRITQGKIRLQLERLELGSLVQRVAEDQRPAFAASGVELEVHLGEGPLLVRGDPTRLEQVVANLLHNSAKFTSRGGRAVLSVGRAADRQVAVTVEDNGTGMNAETLSSLFEPFVQAEKTLDRSRGGLGLGLSLVKALVEQHRGTITASSEGVGRGAKFVVTLPLDQTAELAPAAPAASQPHPPRRVLVVEDNLDAAESLKEVLELEGHTVEVAATGPEGLALAHGFRPDVVVCDIGLPGMDGYEVARRVRADPELRSTRLVALSGYALAEDLQRAREAGFDRHLAKPPQLDELERALAPARRG
ncbi:MAG: hybrid sensor histidine kinase/response regulator [Myxococcaceae bacterium]